jgi:hypothetical protein
MLAVMHARALVIVAAALAPTLGFGLVAGCIGSYGTSAAPAIADASGPSDASTVADSSDASDAPSFAGEGGSVGALRYVFVTSDAFDGSLNGLAGADAKCQLAAERGAFSSLNGRTFRAWLSTKTATAGARLVHGTGGYRRLDNLVVASGWTALAGGQLERPIAMDENGTVITGGFVWTGTKPDGTAVDANCGAWSSGASTSTGAVGKIGSTDARWSYDSEVSCATNARLYCVEL